MQTPRCQIIRPQEHDAHASRAPRARRAMPVLALALLAVAACGQNSASRDAAPAAGASPSGAVAAQPSAAPAVPAPVDAVGHYGEDAYDMVKASDWTRARASVDSLTSAIAGLTPAPGAGAPSPADVHSALQALDHAVTARNRMAGLREANHLTELGANLAAGYHPQVPTAVTLLDYYGRELEIWSTAKDGAKLRETTTAIRQTWTALRAQVEARGGTAEATGFDALVTRLESATTPSAYAAVATPILDAVDGLEKVFTR